MRKRSSMSFVADVSAAVIDQALERWSTFAQLAAESETVTIADGCLLGYLTWTVFWADASRDVIVRYVRPAGKALNPVRSDVIHLRPIDVDGCWSDLR